MPPPTRGLRGLPPQVWTLGWVSLSTDAATEAIYPLLPYFLTRVLGAGALSLGLIEGFAEAAGSVVKVLSGRWSDRAQARKPIVFGGYALSAAVRPLIAISTAWPQVLGIRFIDRMGKGIRGAPRDAMLAGAVTAETRGLAFGFHRAMDHTGAIVGPLMAALVLFLYPGRYRLLFGLTIVPGLIAVLLLLRLREPDSRSPIAVCGTVGAGGSPWRSLPANFWRYQAVLMVFGLGNSTDTFLLLRLTDASGGAAAIPLLWAALHVVKATMSVWGGRLSDRIDRRLVIAGGWIVYAAVYGGFAVSQSVHSLVIWFLIYGVYFGMTEGVEKALIADFTPAALRGTAFGIYNAVLGVGALMSSVAFGIIWKVLGAPAAFASGATLALLAAVMLLTVVPLRR